MWRQHSTESEEVLGPPNRRPRKEVEEKNMSKAIRRLRKFYQDRGKVMHPLFQKI